MVQCLGLGLGSQNFLGQVHLLDKMTTMISENGLATLMLVTNVGDDLCW